MAGDWIKMRVWLSRDPKVIAVANFLLRQREFTDWLGLDFAVAQHAHTGAHMGAHNLRTSCAQDGAHGAHMLCIAVCVTVTSLLQVWGVTNEHGKTEDDDLVLTHASLETLDEVAGVPNLGLGMASVGWAVVEQDEQGTCCVRFPKFLSNNIPADERRRKANADRVAKKRRIGARAQSAHSVRAHCAHTDADDERTRCAQKRLREEEIKEEYLNTPLPPKGGGGEWFDPSLAAVTAANVVAHYDAVTKTSHLGSDQAEAVVRDLLAYHGATEEALKAASTNFAALCDRDGRDASKRNGAKAFFGGGLWKRFVTGTPPAAVGRETTEPPQPTAEDVQAEARRKNEEMAKRFPLPGDQQTGGP